MSWGIHRPVTPDIAKKILELFLGGMSVNHIVFTLDYNYKIDDVLSVIREELRKHVTPR